jgi:phage terminase small subunit
MLKIMKMSLNVKQIRFVIAYCDNGGNATEAAKSAGYSPESAHSQGSRLLQNAEIQEAIKERERELASAAGLNVQWVLDQWRRIAEADPNDLTRVERVNCRSCYGIDHLPQWTTLEYSQALNTALDKGKPAPDIAGGLGFVLRRDPSPECPICGGMGEEKVWIADTGKLKGSARRLFAGVKQTQHGIEIKMRDQDGAVANISKYLGMLIDRKELSAPGGGPIAVANITADDLTDDQIAAILLGGAVA